MLKVVAIMLSGMAVGFLLRKRRLRVVPHLVTVLIWALLFFLGTGIAGTILFSWALWRWVSHRKGGDDR